MSKDSRSLIMAHHFYMIHTWQSLIPPGGKKGLQDLMLEGIISLQNSSVFDKHFVDCLVVNSIFSLFLS